MKMNSQIAATDSAAGANTVGGDPEGIVDDQRMIDGNPTLVRRLVLEEQIRAIELPAQRAQGQAAGAADVEGIEAAAAEVNERAGNAMVGSVVPGSEIGSGAAKNSRCNMSVQLAAEVTAINRVEAHRPRQVETAESRHPRGIRIVVVELHGIGLMERVLDSLLLELRMSVNSAPPVALQVPMRPEQVGHVALERNAALCASSGTRTRAGNVAVVESDPSLNTASRGAVKLRLCPAIRFGRHDRFDRQVNGGESVSGSCSARRFGVLRSQYCDIAAFDGMFGFAHFGHRRTGSDR